MHITRMVEEMDPRRFTTQEAARLAGVSFSTLKRWKSGLFVPKEWRLFGTITVDLYRPEDIPVLIQIRNSNHPGRKRREPRSHEGVAVLSRLGSGARRDS